MPEARWELIARSIRERVENGDLCPGDKLPTEVELAGHWKVARMTVHQAMQELRREGLITRRRRAGTIIAERKHRKTGAIALMLQYQDNPFENGYATGVRAGLTNQHPLIVYHARDEVETEIEQIKRVPQVADGLVCMPTANPRSSAALEQIMSLGTPVVCVDRVPRGIDIDAVVTDNSESTYQALLQLIKQGHEKIAFFGADRPDISAAQERYEGYVRAMLEAGHKNSDEWVRWFPPGPPWKYQLQSTKDALWRMLRENERPTVIFAMNDVYLAAVMEACNQLGIRIPDDFEVISYCDFPEWTTRNLDKIHRLIQQTEKVGKTAIELLIGRIQGNTSPKEIIKIPALYHPREQHRHQHMT